MTANDEFQPLTSVRLAFADESSFAHVTDPVHEDLSAAARIADYLFLCCDETAGVDRLTPVGDGHWGHHTHFNLARMFDLPDGPDGEMDIEGLATDAGWLWVVGSHALERGKPEREKHDAAKALERLRRLERDPDRFFLGRVRSHRRATGWSGPRTAPASAAPGACRSRRRPARCGSGARTSPCSRPPSHCPRRRTASTSRAWRCRATASGSACAGRS